MVNRDRKGSREESGSRASVVGMFLGGGYLAVAAAVKAEERGIRHLKERKRVR